METNPFIVEMVFDRATKNKFRFSSTSDAPSCEDVYINKWAFKDGDGKMRDVRRIEVVINILEEGGLEPPRHG